MQVSDSPQLAHAASPASAGDWWLSALCAETDPEAFFPERGGSSSAAKAVCAGCPVRAECLEYAIANDERFGVWGGTTENERRRLRRLTAAHGTGRPVLTTPTAVLTRETV